MDVEPGFPCLNCGNPEVQVFWSKIGLREGWSCPVCKSRGYFKHEGARDIAILIEA